LRYFSPGHVVDALKLGLDTPPPGFFWLLDGFCRIFGQTPLAIRLPSILGFYMFSVSVYLLLRKRVQWPIAVFASFLTCVTGAAYSSTNARPFAIVVGCFGLAAVAWADFPLSKHHKVRVLITILALAIATGVHFLAVYLVGALAIAELFRTLLDRKIQWSYWGGLIVGPAMLLLWLPVIGPIYRLTHASIHAAGYYAKPTPSSLLVFFLQVVLDARIERIDILLAVILIPLMLVLVSPKKYLGWLSSHICVPSTEYDNDYRDLYILAVSAFSLPFIAFAFAALVTGTFNERYFIAAVLGVVLLAARGLNTLRCGVLLACILMVVDIGLLVRQSLHTVPGSDARITLIQNAPESLPVVPSYFDDYLELSEALPSTLRNRIAYVEMPVGYSSPDPEPDLISRNWNSAIPSLPIYTAEHWFGKTKVFYVLCTDDGRSGLSDWLIAHARTQPVKHVGNDWLFRVDVP
jgi:hypothetical protein